MIEGEKGGKSPFRFGICIKRTAALIKTMVNNFNEFLLQFPPKTQENNAMIATFDRTIEEYFEQPSIKRRR